MNIALDVQTQRMKIGVSDIWEGLSKKYEFEDELQDGFYISGVENESYNSDDTRAYVDKFPDEATDTWDSIKCAISCLKKEGRMCEKGACVWVTVFLFAHRCMLVLIILYPPHPHLTHSKG